METDSKPWMNCPSSPINRQTHLTEEDQIIPYPSDQKQTVLAGEGVAIINDSIIFSTGVMKPLLTDDTGDDTGDTDDPFLCFFRVLCVPILQQTNHTSVFFPLGFLAFCFLGCLLSFSFGLACHVFKMCVTCEVEAWGF